MKQIKERAIVLRRTNFSDADRIVNFITPSGNFSALARGSRRQKSKLAGGIELFTLNEITLIQGKTDLLTLSSSRMLEFFGEIIKDFDRMEFGYFAVQKIEKSSAQIHSEEFFEILLKTFRALNDFDVPLFLIRAWFFVNLAHACGDEINLFTDCFGAELRADVKYSFDIFDKAFSPNQKGQFDASHIKFLRLLLSNEPKRLTKIKNLTQITSDISQIIKSL